MVDRIFGPNAKALIITRDLEARKLALRGVYGPPIDMLRKSLGNEMKKLEDEAIGKLLELPLFAQKDSPHAKLLLLPDIDRGFYVEDSGCMGVPISECRVGEGARHAKREVAGDLLDLGLVRASHDASAYAEYHLTFFGERFVKALKLRDMERTATPTTIPETAQT